VNKNIKVNKNVYVTKNVYVKNWSRKPYYGNVIAGVALGTIWQPPLCPSRLHPISVGTGPIPHTIAAIGIIATKLGGLPASPHRSEAAVLHS
jgi:hypothetical protein